MGLWSMIPNMLQIARQPSLRSGFWKLRLVCIGFLDECVTDAKSKT